MKKKIVEKDEIEKRYRCPQCKCEAIGFVQSLFGYWTVYCKECGHGDSAVSREILEKLWEYKEESDE